MQPTLRVVLPAGVIVLCTVVALFAATSATGRGQAAPTNTQAPFIAAQTLIKTGSTLQGNRGTWKGTAPITYAYQWLRCNAEAQACTEITSANSTTYKVVVADVGHRIRLRVTASNVDGNTDAVSGPTAAVSEEGSGIITLPNGEKSIAVTAIPDDQRLIVDTVRFTPNPVTSRDVPFQVKIKVEDTQNHVVRGALVFIRSTPILSAVPTDAPTGEDGWITYRIQPRHDWPLKNGANVQFFVKAYRQGDPTLAGIRGDRLVQVAVASP
jgi:hypothetical protein